MSVDIPYASVLGTNFVPSESDVQIINAYLAESLSEISQLNLEINRLQAKRDDICARIRPYQALLSLIRRLPLDIMERIFLACLPTERNPAISTLEAPLKLGRICSSWRSFAYSCPRLWSRIHIPVLHLGEIPSESIHTDIGGDWYYDEIHEERVEEAMVGIHHHLDGIRGWLGRAGLHPLSISIFSPKYSVREGAVLPLLRTLLPFSKQWQDLKFLVSWDYEILSEFTQHLSVVEVPILRSVHFRDLDFKSNSPEPFKWLLAPNLRSLHAVKIPSTMLQKLGIHQPTLTELTLFGPLVTPSDAASILIGCANIVKCALEVSLLGNNNLPKSIELRRLESLTFYERVPFPVSLRLPNLCDLSFGSECQGEIPRFDLLSTLSNVHLNTLVLDLSSLTPENVLEYLLLSFRLRHLKFSPLKEIASCHSHFGMEEGIMAKVIDALSPTENDDLLTTTFCPNLEILECEKWAYFSDKALETLITRRASPRFEGGMLRRVAVDFTSDLGRPMTIDLWESLENVVDDEFDLELYYEDEWELEAKLSAWSGVGTAEMVPEWALGGISTEITI